MSYPDIPEIIPNWIDGRESDASTGETLPKVSPVTGKEICRVARSRSADVGRAVDSAAARAFAAWSALTPVGAATCCWPSPGTRCAGARRLAAIVAAETGMSFKAALAETGGAIALGEFMAGEGRRLYGRTTTSAVPNKYDDDRARTARGRRPHHRRQHPDRQRRLEGVPGPGVRQRRRAQGRRGHPGHGLVLRPHRPRGRPAARGAQHRPGLRAKRPARRWWPTRAWPWSASRARPRSAARSRASAGSRLARVSLELGGKNPLVVCDDADLDQAARGRSSRPSATPASAARPAAASSSSTRSTTASATCWWSAPGG